MYGNKYVCIIIAEILTKLMYNYQVKLLTEAILYLTKVFFISILVFIHSNDCTGS